VEHPFITRLESQNESQDDSEISSIVSDELSSDND
jgi:hypothetical protein